MTDAQLTALISTSGAVIVAIASLAINTFWINRSLNRVDKRLEIIEADIKEWNRVFGRIDTDVQRLKDKTGLS